MKESLRVALAAVGAIISSDDFDDRHSDVGAQNVARAQSLLIRARSLIRNLDREDVDSSTFLPR